MPSPRPVVLVDATLLRTVTGFYGMGRFAYDLLHGLEQTRAEVKTLKGLLPICCGCKKIRDDKNYWNEVEIYIMQRTDAKFTHDYCPTCLKKYFPGYT